MRIVILGATGHIGQAILRRALAQNHWVTAVSRQADPVALRGLGVNIGRVDDGFGALTEIAAGHHLIVDAAAPYPLQPCLPGSERWRLAVDAAVWRTQKVIAAARYNRTRLAFVSSFTTLPRREPPLFAMETAWRRSMYPYFEAKAAMEQTVMAAARQGLPAVIVNPVACLGPWEFRGDGSGDGSSIGSGFVGAVLERRLPVVMDHALSVVDVRDVALGIDLAFARECFGRPIPLAGHNVTIAALAARIAALDGFEATPMGLDGRLASMGAFWTGAAFAAFGLAVPDTLGAVILTADSFPMQPSPEQIALGVTIRPLDDTLRDAVTFYRRRHTV